MSNAVLLLRLPLGIYNTGARAIIVRDLRCWFREDQTQQISPLPWRTTRRTIRPGPDDVDDFPVPFPVPGRQARTAIIEFGGPLPGFTIGSGTYRVNVQVLEDRSNAWRRLVEFDLGVADTAQLQRYLAYPNVPPDAEELGRARRLFQHLLLRLQGPST